MSTWIIVIAWIAGIVGIIGSIVPGLPGPPISWLGFLALYLGGDEMSLTFLLVWLGVTVAITVLDYFVPAYFTKITGGTKYASRGALLGMLAGMILTPIGMMLGAFWGAFMGEKLVAKKPAGPSFLAALGAFLGILFGTGAKLIVTIWMMVDIFKITVL